MGMFSLQIGIPGTNYLGMRDFDSVVIVGRQEDTHFRFEMIMQSKDNESITSLCMNQSNPVIMVHWLMVS